MTSHYHDTGHYKSQHSVNGTGEQRIISVNTMGPQQGTTTANVTHLYHFAAKQNGTSLDISLLVLVAAMCTERTQPEWRSPAAKGTTKRCNNNNVLFLHIGAHSPPQSKEQNSQNKLWQVRTRTHTQSIAGIDELSKMI